MNDMQVKDNLNNNRLGQTEKNTRCSACGGELVYSPGTNFLKCISCNSEKEILLNPEKNEIKESDYFSELESLASSAPKEELLIVGCNTCAATVTLKPNIAADFCPYCGTSLVVKDASLCPVLKPDYILPFGIDLKTAKEAYEKWIDSLWFAPDSLKKAKNNPEKLQGVYMPYWTYDTTTYIHYKGQKGTIQLKTIYLRDLKGNQISQAIPQTSWYPTHGNITDFFNDILVPATQSLPESLLNTLTPWNLNDLEVFSNAYLSGYRAETYAVGLEQGFIKARQVIEKRVERIVKNDIGGDRQKITETSITHHNITFKHILLPIWISSFRYHRKNYSFTINAQTGEVSGERPYSIFKIICAGLGGIVLIALLVYIIFTSFSV